jgi:acetyltransferase-like isoleucine patch superfamily enzyme
MFKIFLCLIKCKRFFTNFRENLYKKVYYYEVIKKAKHVGTDLKVNNKSHVTPNTILGDNVSFNGMDIHGFGQVKIGNNFHSGSGCNIFVSHHNYDHGNAIPYDDTLYDVNVIIEDNVWLGSNVAILGGGGAKDITIGEGAVIQYGSVVVSSIPPLAVVGGHPARVFKYRDKEHYFKLKEQGKFY